MGSDRANEARSASSGALPHSASLRAVARLPLQSTEHNKLLAFYAVLADGRLTTTHGARCGRIDRPPRAFCPSCTPDGFEWIDPPREGELHGFTTQDTGIPPGFTRPLIFTIVTVAGLRIFAPLTGVSDLARLALGDRVRCRPVRVADGPPGEPRYLLAFTPVAPGS